MATQNDKTKELLLRIFEYVVYLKAENARLAASDKSKDEIIEQKENEALAIKQQFDEYVANDMDEDESLIAMLDNADVELGGLMEGR